MKKKKKATQTSLSKGGNRKTKSKKGTNSDKNSNIDASSNWLLNSIKEVMRIKRNPNYRETHSFDRYLDEDI